MIHEFVADKKQGAHFCEITKLYVNCPVLLFINLLLNGIILKQNNICGRPLTRLIGLFAAGSESKYIGPPRTPRTRRARLFLDILLVVPGCCGVLRADSPRWGHWMLQRHHHTLSSVHRPTHQLSASAPTNWLPPTDPADQLTDRHDGKLGLPAGGVG